MALDPNRLTALMGKLVGDLGAMMSIGPMIVGEKLGLYKAMADGALITAAELAAKTHTHERYVQEWLCAQAASGFVEYDPASDRFRMTEEQTAALGAEGGPFYIFGAIELAVAMVKDEPKILQAFRTGEGVGWHEHDLCLFRGTERFFRPGYMRHLLSEWIPALDGVKEKLAVGGRGLWTRRVDDPDGAGLPKQPLFRLRLSRTFDREGARGRGDSRRGRQNHV